VGYGRAEAGAGSGVASRRELLDAIRRPRTEGRAKNQVAAPRVSAARRKAGLKGVLHLEVRYRDLAATVGRVTRALEDARVSYAIQPLGSGEFVVEAEVQEVLASDLARRLAALGVPPLDERQQAALAAAEPTGQTAHAVATRAGGRRAVRLIVRFRPAAAQRR